jgi:hypothetical protein
MRMNIVASHLHCRQSTQLGLFDSSPERDNALAEVKRQVNATDREVQAEKRRDVATQG